MKLPVVHYCSCEECGESGVCIGPAMKPSWFAAARLQLRRCPECGANGREIYTERERPDEDMYREAAAHYDLVKRDPGRFASPEALA